MKSVILATALMTAIVGGVALSMGLIGTTQPSAAGTVAETPVADEPVAYVPANPPDGRFDVELDFVVHVIELLEPGMTSPPDMPMEEYAALHMPGYVEETECRVLTDTIAAHCVMTAMRMEPLGEGNFLVKADFDYSPSDDPQLALYRSYDDADHDSEGFGPYKNMYLRGTAEELEDIRRNTYLFGSRKCDAIGDQVEACHMTKVVMRFTPPEDGAPGVETYTRVYLHWAWPEGDG